MQLLVVSYTPGSSLLHCLEADQPPTVGDTIEAHRIRAKVLHAERLHHVQGYDCAVVVDDLSVAEQATDVPWS